MPLSGHRVETSPEMSSHTTCQGTWPQSPQLAEPLWTDPGVKSGMSVCKLMSTLEEEKKAQAGNDWLNYLPKVFATRKESHQPLSILFTVIHMTLLKANPLNLWNETNDRISPTNCLPGLLLNMFCVLSSSSNTKQRTISFSSPGFVHHCSDTGVPFVLMCH